MVPFLLFASPLSSAPSGAVPGVVAPSLPSGSHASQARSLRLRRSVLDAGESPKERLVWADEFSKPGRPDPASWTFETGFSRNEELQWYQAANARVEGGNLVIEGRRERVPNPGYEAGSTDWRKKREFAEYTSACVKTMGLRTWQYGRFEIRAKIIAKPGLWPAIWTLGAERPWPLCGEIDIMEHYQNSLLANTVYSKDGGIWETAKIPLADITKGDPKWDQKFHVWRMDWDESSIKLSLDGRLLNETDTTNTRNPDGFNPFHQPHYILLNLAIGSTGGDPSGTEFPSRYEIDYVRVYQR
ncbi:glycoside hydrolase family 16 protein [bacterium]|nr:MAG: glycoside hydrolase family 16 protein [bacterium]